METILHLLWHLRNNPIVRFILVFIFLVVVFGTVGVIENL